MKPAIQLSESFIMDSLTNNQDPGSDAEEGEASPPLDPLLLEKAYQLCKASLNTAGRVPKDSDKRVVNLLQASGLVNVAESGEIILSRDSVSYGTQVDCPVLERSLRQSRTTLELMQDLRQNGWRFRRDITRASVKCLRGAIENPKSYYMLLTHFPDNLIMYEEDGLFHHRQSEQYYRALEMAIMISADDIVEIPANKSAQFYIQLQKFLDNPEEVVDPREAEPQKRKRTAQLHCTNQSWTQRSIPNFVHSPFV